MEELIYLLKVDTANGVSADVAKRLHLDKSPEWVRLATLAPLSNYGYKPDSEGQLLHMDQFGVVVGVAGDEDVPRQFVPWQNIAYLGDGAKLAASR